MTDIVERLMRPMVALKIAGKANRDAVMSGSKRVTIRAGHRDYQIGDSLMLGCGYLGWADMNNHITHVMHTRLGLVSQRDLKADGFSSLHDAMCGLRQYYPMIDENSDVTVIRWAHIGEAESE